ncbi:hypothetical protein V1525DRAFT_436306, partial [Lipomyces kononenkoae]
MPYDTYQRLLYDEEQDDEAVVIAVALAQMRTINTRRNRFYLTRPVLLWPRLSPWQRLRDSAEDKAFWVQTRLTTPITRDDVSVHGEARRSQRSLDADGALGLVLHFLNSSMAQFTLNEIFGIVPA